MHEFLSCDWGTSSFRLKLIEGESLRVKAEQASDKGISATYSLWLKSGSINEEERFLFYLNTIQEYIRKIEQEVNTSLEGLPLIISGMASSSIGMKHLPYGNLPFLIDGSDIKVEYFKASTKFKNPVLLISGVKDDDDVMRGEETQLIGAIEEEDNIGEKIFIFPGTHSKHIIIRGKEVTGFKTYMTGEFFQLLSEKSILKEGLVRNNDRQDLIYQHSFQHGVRDAIGSNLLNLAFRVRTNELFDKFSKKENYNYLSGLLIGTELQDISYATPEKIYISCASNLKHWYKTAIQELQLSDKVHIFPVQSAEEAVIRGQLKIFNHYVSNQ